MSSAPASSSPDSRSLLPGSGLLREVLLAVAGATAACVLLSRLQEHVPFLRANLYVLVAAIFLYLPMVLLRRRGLTTLDVGLTTHPRGRGLAFALAAMALTFPPFAIGFHYWQGMVLGNRPAFEADAYRRWPAVWEGRPGRGSSLDGLTLYVEGSELRLRWPSLGQEPLAIGLRSDGRLELSGSTGVRVVRQGPGQVELRARRAGEARLWVSGGEQLEIAPTLGAVPLARERIFLGAAGEHPDSVPFEAHRSLIWVLLLALSHLLLVALPEELFYRGYVQTTLDRIWPRRWRVLGVELGMSVVVASVLFALGHFLVDLRAERLAVFFPSLLFGYLRAGTGSLAAPILFHAASNIFSDLLGKGYMG